MASNETKIEFQGILENEQLDELNSSIVNDDAIGEHEESILMDASASSLDTRKHCWVCFLHEDDEESENEWIKPCRCKGTAKWVHQTCLQRWIDEKQKNNSTLPVSCPQCKVEYIMVFPPTGPLIYVIELYDRILYAISPFVAASFVIGSIYWTSFCYGAATVLQVCGMEEGKQFLEVSEPLMLFVGLPTIPVALIVSKLIRWEYGILNWWQENYLKVPLMRFIIGDTPKQVRSSAERILSQRDTFSEPLSATRNFVGALLLPTAATIVGRVLYNNVQSNFKRTIFGGLTFILVKGLTKIVLRQQQYIRQTNRKVVNYNDVDENDSSIKDQIISSPVTSEDDV